MAKINTINIPMGSKVALAEVDTKIHTADEPAFAEKNSITFKGVISNARVTSGDGFLTTTGKEIKTKQLQENRSWNGKTSIQKSGTTLIDYTGKEYDIKYDWVLSDSKKVIKYSGGKIVDTTIYGDNIYTLYNDNEKYTLVTTNKDTQELVKAETIDGISACISSCIYNKHLLTLTNPNIGPFFDDYSLADKPLLCVLKSQTENGNNLLNIYAVNDTSTILATNSFSGVTVPLGHKMTAANGYTVELDGTNVTSCIYVVVGFEDVDQQRCGSLFIRKVHSETRNGSSPVTNSYTDFIKYLGCIDPQGIATGEPFPVLKSNNIVKYITPSRLTNGCLKWDIKSNIDALHTQTNQDVTENLIARTDGLCKMSNMTYDTTYGCLAMAANGTPGNWISVNIAINDSIPTEGPFANLNPKEIFISNWADARGVYFDYGQGWSKFYLRVASQQNSIIRDLRIETNNSKTNGGIGRRTEHLMCPSSRSGVNYEANHLNEVIYNIGGNNKGENSILSTIPFNADLLYYPLYPDKYFNPSGDKVQAIRLSNIIYGLTPIAISFDEKVLIDTPSENKNEDNYNIHIETEADENDITNIFGLNINIILSKADEMYIIKKTSDVSELSIKKVGDYKFKLNTLNTSNFIEEDRLGNISVSRAFIPYSMQCYIDIEKLKLTFPIAAGLARVRDPNDAWYEGIGYNVNLDVEKPSMSFLLPKIRLPLYISDVDWQAFKTYTIDEKNSILKPIIGNTFSAEEDGVDVYFTLQKDSQDCTYKVTNKIPKTFTGLSAEIKKEYQESGRPIFNILKKNTSWWIEDANAVLFPIGTGSTIKGINYITPSVQLPENYSARLYTVNNQLYMGFNFLNQVWYGGNIFTIYGSNYYYDGQAIYFIGSENDFSNNSFVSYALGMRFLANSGSEAYFFSDFEKRLYIFTGSNALQPADLLSDVDGIIIDAIYSSKEQALYMLTSNNKVLLRTQTDFCELTDLSLEGERGHLEGTTEGCAFIYNNKYKIFSPWKGNDVLPLRVKTDHIGSPDFISRLSFVDVVLHKSDNCTEPIIKFTSQTLNGIEATDEEVFIEIKQSDWKGKNYRFRFTPRLNNGNAFNIGVYSKDEVGVQNITFYMLPQDAGRGDNWQNNIIGNKEPSISF